MDFEGSSDSDSNSSTPSSHPKVESLRNLAVKVELPHQKNLLHQFVLDQSDSNRAANNSFLNAVLLAMHDIPGCIANALSWDKYTALHLAVINNNLTVVKKLLSCVANIDVDARTKVHKGPFSTRPWFWDNGYGALHFAVKNGHISIATELLHKGASVDLLNGRKETPLGLAAKSGNLKLVEFLVSSGADVNFRFGKTPLGCATEHLAISKHLVSLGAEVNMADFRGRRPLHYAVDKGHLEVVELLVKHGAEVNARDQDGRTPLCDAAACRWRLEIMEYLLKNGADVSARNNERRTPLHEASRYGKSENVGYLLDYGADIQATSSNGETPLHEAVIKQRFLTIELLMSRGADVNAQDSCNGTPLLRAAEYCESKIVELLMSQGADVNAQTRLKRTPLHIAVARHKLKMVELLINQGSNINAQDQLSETPLHLAVKAKNNLILSFLRFNKEWKNQDAVGKANLKIVKFLLDRGSDLLAIGKEGEILMCEQISKVFDFICKESGGWIYGEEYRNRSKVIQILLDKGADTSVRNKKGETPLDLARNKQCIDILEQNIEGCDYLPPSKRPRMYSEE